MLRPYQSQIAADAAKRLQNLGIAYLAVEMRVGKTLMALETARQIKATKVVFLTKLKAISSVIDDAQREGYTEYTLTVSNYEQIHNHTEALREADFIILDESHGLGMFPKPAMKAKALREVVGNKPVLFLSGTPSPESYSQLYHQFFVSHNSPWAAYKNFYAWAKDYVDVRLRRFGALQVKDYSQAKQEKVLADLAPYMISFTQEEAGFDVHEVEERIIEVPMKPRTYDLMEQLRKRRIAVYQSPHGEREVVADTAVAYRAKVHQLCSGSVIFESSRHTGKQWYDFIDFSKIEYIRDNYHDQKVAVFYQFTAERKMLESLMPNTTSDPKEFASNQNLVYISQIQAGSQGVDLSSADALIFLNLNFSAMHYWQSRARLQTMTRTKAANVHYLFAKGGIERTILETVKRKEDYTLSHFMRDWK